MPVSLRPLGVAELLDTATRTAFRHAPALLAVSVPFAVLRAGGGAALRYASLTSGSGVDALTLIGQVALACLLGTIVAGLLAPVISAALLGEPVRAAEGLRRSRGTRVRLVGLAVVVMLAQTTGLVLLGVGGVWLWGVWAVAAPALVLERTGVRGAFGRSVTLVRTQFWRAWGIRSLRWLVTTLLGLVVTAPFTVLAAYLADVNLLRPEGVTDAGLYVAITAVGDLLGIALMSPISAAVDTVLYLDLRVRREGIDILLALPQRVPA